MNAPDSQPDMLDHDSAGVSKPVEAPRLVVRINSVAMKIRDTVQCLPKWLPPRGDFQLQRESQQ